MSTINHLDLTTLESISRGVNDINHNGIFDEGDVLKGDERRAGYFQSGGVNACRGQFLKGDFVLTPEDTKTDKDLEAFFWRALHREVRFFNAQSKDGKDQLYVAISRQDCYDDEDAKLEYVVRIKTYAGHIGDSYGYGEKDEFISFEPGLDMKTWLQSAESYLSNK